MTDHLRRGNVKSDRADRAVARRTRWIFAICTVGLCLVLIATLRGFSPEAKEASSPPWVDPSVVTTPSVGAAVTDGVACAAFPSSCGYPDATNTGVLDDSVLARVPEDISAGDGWQWDERGWIVVDGDCAVLENVETASGIDVSAADVTISNVRIRAYGESWGIGLKHTRNLTVKNVSISSTFGKPRLLVGVKDVYGDATGTRILSSDISGVSTGIQTHEGVIADNYIHDFGYIDGDHINGTTSNGSTVPMTIRHNTILNQYDQADAISLFQDFGPEANRTIEDNLLAGGSYTIYGGEGGSGSGAPSAYNININHNRFSRIHFPQGGAFGPIGAFNPAAKGNSFEGNVWDENNLPVTLP